jgi:hypothetical protein
MKRTFVTVALVALVMSSVVSNARAEVSSISLRFGGGCLTSNTTGSCVLKPRFAGFDLETETAVLFVCSNARGGCRKYSPRLHPVSEAGEASIRIKNIPGGCFQVRTGPNGNDLPDAASPIVCEQK